jgi:hypothetical protein
MKGEESWFEMVSNGQSWILGKTRIEIDEQVEFSWGRRTRDIDGNNRHRRRVDHRPTTPKTSRRLREVSINVGIHIQITYFFSKVAGWKKI